jgi:hypothetical protein
MEKIKLVRCRSKTVAKQLLTACSAGYVPADYDEREGMIVLLPHDYAGSGVYPRIAENGTVVPAEQAPARDINGGAYAVTTHEVPAITRQSLRELSQNRMLAQVPARRDQQMRHVRTPLADVIARESMEADEVHTFLDDNEPPTRAEESLRASRPIEVGQGQGVLRAGARPAVTLGLIAEFKELDLGDIKTALGAPRQASYNTLLGLMERGLIKRVTHEGRGRGFYRLADDIDDAIALDAIVQAKRSGAWERLKQIKGKSQ